MARNTGKVGKPLGAKVQRPATRLLTAQRMLELQVKGVPQEDIAKAHNTTRQTVQNTVKWGIEHGAVDAVRDRLQKQLDKIPNVYAEILDLDSKDISVTEMAMKIRDLKLKAAKQLAEGMGPFRKEVSTMRLTETIDLDQFYKLRAARAAGVLPPSDIPALPEHIEGDVIEEVPDGK